MTATRLTPLLLLLGLILLTHCSSQSGLPDPMAADAEQINAVRENLPAHEVQWLFSEVIRNDEGEESDESGETISFREQSFQLAEEQYFYPASTVKLPVALLALEKLAEDPRLDRNTPFRLQGEDEITTVGRELIELFVVSDNVAFNRLFDYIGKDEINRRLIAKGLGARIAHRLSVPDSDRLDYAAIEFYTEAGTLVHQTPDSSPIRRLPLEGQIKGVAYQENGSIISEPFDFREKNHLPIASLHGIMKRLMYPELFTADQRFQLDNDDRDFVLRIMATLPPEVGFDPAEFPDNYVKFLIFGDYPGPLPDYIEIRNKVGFAYGTLTDTAHILDTRSGREFIITATVLVNENQTFNDNVYEYDEIGMPFLAELGRQLTGIFPADE